MITQEFKTVLQNLLLYGQSYSSYNSYSGKNSMVLPNAICVWVFDGVNLVAKSQVTLSSLVQGNGTLSFTLTAIFNSSFTGTELRLVATVNGTLLYVISIHDENVQSSSDNPLHVEWDITVSVNNVFQLPNFIANSQPLPCVIQGYCGCVVFYFVALLAIPDPYFSIPSIAPNSNIARVFSITPQGQLCGISVIAFISGTGVGKNYGKVEGQIGTILASQSYNQPPYYVVVYYKIGKQLIPLMYTEIGNIQTGVAYSFKICINIY